MGVAEEGYDEIMKLAYQRFDATLTPNLTADEIHNALEEVVYELYDRHINPYYTEPETVLQAIIGVSFVGNKPQMYKTYRSTLRQADRIEFVGAGEILARYLSDQLEGAALNLDQAKFFAVDILSAVKAYTPFCGGNTDVLIVTADGKAENMDVIDREDAEYQTFIVQYYLRPLLLSYADKTVSEENFLAALQEFTDLLKKLRKESEERRSFWKTFLGKNRKDKS